MSNKFLKLAKLKPIRARIKMDNASSQAPFGIKYKVPVVIIPIAALVIILLLFYWMFKKFGSKIFKRSKKSANV